VYFKRCAGIGVLLMIAAILAACAGKTSQTYVDRVARAKELPNAPYSDILIVAITARGATAREFEEKKKLFARLRQSRGPMELFSSPAVSLVPRRK